MRGGGAARPLPQLEQARGPSAGARSQRQRRYTRHRGGEERARGPLRVPRHQQRGLRRGRDHPARDGGRGRGEPRHGGGGGRGWGRGHPHLRLAEPRGLAAGVEQGGGRGPGARGAAAGGGAEPAQGHRQGRGGLHLHRHGPGRRAAAAAGPRAGAGRPGRRAQCRHHARAADGGPGRDRGAGVPRHGPGDQSALTIWSRDTVLTSHWPAGARAELEQGGRGAEQQRQRAGGGRGADREPRPGGDAVILTI